MANPNDKCRICKCDLRAKFWSTAVNRRISTENLFKPSKREGLQGSLSADICASPYINLVRDPRLYSERVCNPCARKIRNLGHLFGLINGSVNRGGKG